MDYYNQQPPRKNSWSYLLMGIIGALIGGLIMVIAFNFYDPVKNPPTAEGQEQEEEPQPGEGQEELPPITLDNLSTTVIAISKQTKQSVVGITNFRRQRNIYGEVSLVPAGTGSGVVIGSNEGYIVTNNHVVAQAEAVSVTLDDGTEIDAEVIGTDTYSDLAVIKINPEGLGLKEIALGDSDLVQVGELVIAVGNPLGFEQTVTVGFISATEREVLVNDSIFTYLQTDAAINEGNSGGALVNSSGQLIGINSAKILAEGVEGMGFAIPSNTVRAVINELIEYGSVRRPWMGIYIQDNINALKAKHYGLEIDYGVLVGDVENGSPADKAGIRAGDVIIAIDGERIENYYQLQQELFGHKIDDTIQVTLQRENKKIAADITLMERPTELLE